ncbi:MAG: ComEC/Rec2 family competence protein [Acidobacteriota bacterium]
MAEDTKPTFVRYPLLWLAISFSCGIVIEKYFDDGFPVWAIVCLAGAAFAILTMPRTSSAAAVLLSFCALGGVCYQFEIAGVAGDRLKTIYDSQSIKSGEPVEVEGILVGLPELSYDGVFLRLSANRLRYRSQTSDVSGDVRIFVPTSDADSLGDLEALGLQNNSRLLVECALQREENFQNPGVRSRIQSLDEQGLDAVATLKSPLLIQNIGESETFSLTGAIFAQRQRLIEEFRGRFDGKTAGVLIASLLGDKYFLDKQTADLFREGGTFHILVISGLHITFIGGIVLLIAGAFTRNRVWQFLAATAFLWSYTLAVGAEVPVVRASTVFTILLFSRVIHRQGSLLNSLGACALLLLAIRPSSLLTPSFQLTFVSVGAIVGIAFPLITNLRRIGTWMPSSAEPLPPLVSMFLRRFCETLYWRDVMWEFEGKRQIYSGHLFKLPFSRFRGEAALQKAGAYLCEGLLVSLIVQICLLPLVVFYFHRVSIAAVVLNLWVGIVLAAETFAAFAAVAVAQISETLALPLVRLAEAANSLLLAFPRFAVDGGWASARIPVYPAAGHALYVLYFVPVAIAAVMIFRWDPFAHKRNSMRRLMVATAAGVCLVGSIIFFHPFSSPRADGKLRIDFLDVGQGDSALVTFPNGETMLVDGGGRPVFRNSDDESDAESFEPDVPRIGEAVVSEFLWQKGYSGIDRIVATHADSDHIQGLSDVAANFAVGQVMVGRTAVGDVDYDALAAVSRRKNIPLVTVSTGEVLEIGGARVEILNPAAGQGNSDNDNSVVLRIAFGELAFLFTGDIERAAESLIVQNGLNADVVKVPHHGSRTSSSEEFIESANASFAVISVGKKSRFGHPHPEVVERWRDHGAEVWTTGTKGTITFVTDGKELTVESFVR